MAYLLPNLPYDFAALEPYIDAKTMEIHHDKHHATYTANFNKTIEEAGIADKPIEEIFANISKYPISVRNNSGGYFNHSMFWQILSPDISKPSDELAAAINRDFGSFDKFKEQFSNAALMQFGSGWAWLGVGKGGKLQVFNLPNQDNPLMDIAPIKCTPILLLDIWEHAYYLNYQNRRADYIAAFWNIINWAEVSKRFAEIK